MKQLFGFLGLGSLRFEKIESRIFYMKDFQSSMGLFCLFFPAPFCTIFRQTKGNPPSQVGFYDFLLLSIQDGDCITGIRQLPELTSTTTGSAFVLWCHGKPSTPITWGNAAAGDSTSVQGHLRLVDIQVGKTARWWWWC